MKHLFTLILLAFLPALASAQVVVDDVNINEKTEIQYIEVLGINTGMFGKQKLVVTVDYGQKMAVGTDTTIKGPDGKRIIFNSMMDAMNFFYKNGWELVNAFPISDANSTTYHYVLKRKG